MNTTIRSLRECVGGVGLLLMFVAIAGAQPANQDMRDLQPRPLPLGAVVLGESTAMKPSEYWIGLDCRPADTVLRMHLQLDEGVGIVVEGVAPESPAAKAGFQQYDLLLKAGESSLEDIRDLISAVDQAQDGVLTLQLLRKGEPMTLDVNPEKRPQASGATVPPFDPYLRNMEALRKLIEENTGDAQGTMRFRLLHPGVILPSEAEQPDSATAGPSPSVKPDGDSIHQRLETMSRQIEALQRSLDAWMADQAAPSKSATQKPKKEAGK